MIVYDKVAALWPLLHTVAGTQLPFTYPECNLCQWQGPHGYRHVVLHA